MKPLYSISTIALCALLLLSCARKWTTGSVEIENVRIHEDKAVRTQPCEPSIAINPARPNEIVAGSILDFVHVSRDGGKSWNTKELKSGHGVYGDPVLIADEDGNFYYFHLAAPGGKTWGSPRFLESIVVQRSGDGGRNWTDGTAIGYNPPKQQDKQWAAYDPVRDRIHVSWTEFDDYGSRDPDCHSRIRYSWSDDRGESWSEAITLSQKEGNCLDDDQTTEGAVPATGPEGEVYIAWAWDEKIWFDKSLDGGQSWMEEDYIIADQPGGWTMKIPGVMRVNGMPVTECDLSRGEYRGSIYVCWADTRAGLDDSNVYLSYSRDRGESWSNPVAVHSNSKNHQFFPWMCVDPVSGYIYVVSYDRANYDNWLTDVVVSVSRDGGKSFTSRTVSDSPFKTPGPILFFGDYNDISAYNGQIRPIWTRFEDLKYSVWTALIEEPLPDKKKNLP